MVKIFMTGATGHIGGYVLDLALEAYPDAEVGVLVRDSKQANRVLKKYPQVVPIIGDLNSLDVVETAAKESDIVIYAAPDVTHTPAISVILKGLKSRKKKGYYIHTSGASSTWDDQRDGSIATTKIWDDWTDLEELRSLSNAIHHVEDETVFAASSEVYVAVISPSIVYGLSPSIDHPLPITFEPIMKAIEDFGQGFTVGGGRNVQSWIHVKNQASMYILLLSDAIKSLNMDAEPNPDCWGKDAYLFSASEDLPFSDFMTALTKILKSKGIVQTTQLKRVTLEEVAKAMGAEEEGADIWARAIATMCAVNFRVRSTRAEKVGWKCSGPRLGDTLEAMLSKFLELRGSKE